MSKKRKKIVQNVSSPDTVKINQGYIILLVALILVIVFRAIFIHQIKINDPEFFRPTPGTDMGMYDQAALDMINGNPVQGPFFYHPLYYYFLSLNYFIYGHDLLILRIVMACIGVLTWWLTYSIATKLFNRQIGIITALVFAFCGYLIYYESVLLSIGLTTFFCIASIFFLANTDDKVPRLKNFILSGIFIALGCLSQPNVLLFVPMGVFWIMFNWGIKKCWKYVSLYLVAVFITISPVTFKNYLDSGRFVLISTSGEINFWLGNHKGSLGWFDIYGNELEKLEARVKAEGPSVYVNDVIQFIRTEPEEYLKLLLKKVLLFWGSWDIPHQVGYDYGKRYSSLLRMPFMLEFSWIAILGLAGMFISIRRWWRKALLLYLFVIAYSCSVIIIMVHGRYRPPVVPLLIIFVGYLIWWIWEQIKTKRYVNLCGMCGILAILTIFVFSQQIDAKMTCMKNPYGIYKNTSQGLIISDNSNSWHGLDTTTLSMPNMMIKKVFVINKDLSEYRNARLCFRYFSAGNGQMYFQVNGRNSPKITLSTGPFLHKVGYKFTSSLLKKGINEIIFSVPQGSILKIPIDNYYCFSRSFVSEDKGKTWKKIKGEYMIQLELLK
jgi:uncharacterized membrane protein